MPDLKQYSNLFVQTILEQNICRKVNQSVKINIYLKFNFTKVKENTTVLFHIFVLEFEQNFNTY